MGLMDRRILVTLVRHGETKLNLQRVLQGHQDIPLSEVGVQQAETLGKKLAGEKFTVAFSSDLLRAYGTAQAILKHSKFPIEIATDKRLRERSYGVCEGKPVQLMREEAAKKNIRFEDFTPEKGETPGEMMTRAKSFFQELCQLLDAKKQNTEETVLIVSHGGWILYLMRFLHENQDRYTLENFNRDTAVRIHKNTGVSKFQISKGSSPEDANKIVISFNYFNDTSHLSET